MIRYQVADAGIAVLTLDDAARRNALTPALSAALADAVQASLAQGARVLVLAATAPVFCSGGSLDELAKGPAIDLDAAYAGVLALADAPVPTIAAVDGPCIGAGVNLPLACDVVLATPRAVFDPRWLDVRVHPGGGHLWRLEQRVGRQAAAALVLFGERLNGDGAVAHGLAYACVASARVLPSALAMAKRVCERDPELVARTKATLRANNATTDPTDALERERAAQLWSLGRPGFVDHVRSLRTRLPDRRT
jgi:enoyl-CoA hydratase/carnithine racemase